MVQRERDKGERQWYRGRETRESQSGTDGERQGRETEWYMGRETEKDKGERHGRETERYRARETVGERQRERELTSGETQEKLNTYNRFDVSISETQFKRVF